MKKIKNIFAMLLIAIFSCTAFVACGDDDAPPTAPSSGTWLKSTKSQVEAQLDGKTSRPSKFKAEETTKHNGVVVKSYSLEFVEIDDEMVSIFKYSDTIVGEYFELYATTDKVYVNIMNSDGESYNKIYTNLDILLYEYVNIDLKDKYEYDVLENQNELSNEEKSAVVNYKSQNNNISAEIAGYLNKFMPVFLRRNIQYVINSIDTTDIQMKADGSSTEIKLVEEDKSYNIKYAGLNFDTMTILETDEKIINYAVVNEVIETKLESKTLTISLPNDLSDYTYSAKA